jgi:hypothetical protein
VTGRTTIIGTVLTLSLAATVSAQVTGPNEAERRFQRQMFEGGLQTAVRQGGEAFVRQQAPTLPQEIQLTANDPHARGFALPVGGLLFSVAIPNIRVTITDLLIDQLRPQRRADGRLSPGARPAGSIRPGEVSAASGAPGAQGIAPPDPMAVPPATADTPIIDDGRCAMRAKPTTADPSVNYFYAVSVCDAVMDAMLDNSGPLSIKDDDWLTVALVPEADGPGVVNAMSGFTTYLMIKGADLLQYRQGKLSKDAARKLIEMQRH